MSSISVSPLARVVVTHPPRPGAPLACNQRGVATLPGDARAGSRMPRLTMDRPPLAGLWHVALNVTDVERALGFYAGDLGMRVEWRPDPDNVYLTSGRDNLALHKVDRVEEQGRLDHIGFVLPTPEAVDGWAAFLEGRG